MSFGFGLGDFITVGQHVATAIQTLRDSDTTIERLRLLDFEINELEKAIIERRLSNNGIDITQLRDGQRIREGVASMGQALGSCEEAIIRFRKETDKYRGAFEGNCATKGLDRFRQKLDSVGRRMKIAGDLEAALASLERNLSLSMRRYEMHVKAVDRIIETTGQRQTVEYLRSLSNDMAMVKSHLEGTSRQTVASNTQDIREDLVEVKFDIRKLETMMESMLMRSDKDDVGSMTCQQLCRVDRRTLNQRRYPNASRGYRDSQVERKFRSGSLYSGPNDGLMMMEQANALADQKLRALQAKASIAIIPLLATILLIVKCLKYFLGAIPQEIGYVWNSETGRVTSITILDALGGKLVLPQELCDSFSRLHGVLNVHFEKKPGEEKVKKREYCLMTAEGLRLTRDEDLFHATRPGAQITMFMEVKSKHASNTALLDKEGVQYCPQCGISNYYTSHAGVKALNW
ncbi:hypothetical protein BJ508DRAFT_128205 [Ascobolus immersus RN42]|uniref:Ubiquitin-like domain-containing protein n=1 Tax=Ascobolus immersus RN42 TaxID=1160509 RepID=A0A3N4I509_ASCIM|nr:hypothetical protein BJ508DRAFT_128205 [Ascobolus immersus RN42]